MTATRSGKHKRQATGSQRQPVLLGAHFSISGGLENAVFAAMDYGCTALQIFTKNASTWKERELTREEIDRFTRATRNAGIVKIASHTSYLINLASAERNKRDLSLEALSGELTRCTQLDIPAAVLHPGAHMGQGEQKGISRIVDGINAVLDGLPELRTRLLLETTAGQGSSVGHTFEQLAAMMERVERKRRIGVCLDTSHIFAAGYDIRSAKTYDETLSAFDSVIGLDHLHLIHVNDSKKPFGSRVDRHAHIGHGFIGDAAFRRLMTDSRLSEIPKIIETPKEGDGKDWDRDNLDRLMKMALQAVA